jgi:hypothetical protein
MAKNINDYDPLFPPQDVRMLGQIDREKIASLCKLGPAISHPIILSAFVGVRFVHPNLCTLMFQASRKFVMQKKRDKMILSL